MSETNPNWDEVMQFLQLFYPQYFDPDSPHYVDPDILALLDTVAQEARPPCLSEHAQNYAEALYLAYLISLRSETSSGAPSTPEVSGPITSEREGDIAVTYADLTKSNSGSLPSRGRPPTDPWDAWNRMWSRCMKGAILTRYGDPLRSAPVVTATLSRRAIAVWGGI